MATKAQLFARSLALAAKSQGHNLVSLQGRYLGPISPLKVEDASSQEDFGDELRKRLNSSQDINGMPMLDWSTQVPG